MSLYRCLLRPSSFLRPSSILPLSSSRSFAFSSAEEAAAERRRRKRRLRIEPPLHALRRDPSTPRPPRDPNAPREPDSTSNLVGPRLSLHNRVQSFIRSSDLDDASAAARHALFSSTRPTVFTCNAVIFAMYRAKRYDDAVALFRLFFDQSNIVPNVVSYNHLILTHCEAGRVDDALAVYNRILETAPFAPSYVTYQHLTKGLVDADRLPDALGLLREMLTRGLAADSLVYNNVIAGFLEKENFEKALELYDELRERCVVYDGTVVATFMDWYFRKGRGMEAMDEYRALLGKQFQMSAATSNTLLKVLLKHEKVPHAERLFENMLDKHTPPSRHALNTETYNIMVNECFRKGDFQGAVAAFHRTATKPCVMDVGCFNNIIGKLLQNGLIDDARKLFDEMPEKSVNANAETYGLFVDQFFKEGKVEDALQWFESMVNKDGEKAPRVRIDSYNRMYDGLVKAGRIDAAIDIFKKMQERGVKPDSISYEILITVSCIDGLLDQVQSLVEAMVRNRVSPSSKLRELVSKTFDNVGRGEEVGRMFEPPQPAAPLYPSFTPTTPRLGFGVNPSSMAQRTPCDTGNQSSHAGGPPPAHVWGTQAAIVTAPSHFTGPQGTHMASTQPQNVTGPQASQFAASRQPAYNASARSPQFSAQPASMACPQTTNAPAPPFSVSRNSQHLWGTSEVTPTNNWVPSTGQPDASQGISSQTNNLQDSTSSHYSSYVNSQVQHSAHNRGHSFVGKPQDLNLAGPRTSNISASQVPYYGSSGSWNSENTLPAQSGSQNLSDASSLPPFPVNSQNDMVSQAPEYVDRVASQSNSPQDFQRANPVTYKFPASQGPWMAAPQKLEADYPQDVVVADGTNGRY